MSERAERALLALRTEQEGSGRTPLRRLTRRTLGRGGKRLWRDVRALRRGADAEAVHELRVTLRRLRTALAVLREVPGARRGAMRRLDGRLARLARRVGRVRDLDVLEAHLAAYGHDRPWHAPGLRPVRAWVRSERERALKALEQVLNGSRPRETRRALRRLAARPARRDGRRGGAEPLARHFAGGVLRRRYEAVLAFEQELPTATPRTLHRLRIACKRLRYTLELFAEELGPQAEGLLDTLMAAQRSLGDLHDHAVALEWLVPMARAWPRNDALAAYVAARAAEHDRLLAGVAPLWEALAGARFRQELAALLARL